MSGPRSRGLPVGWHAAPPDLQATETTERIVDDDAPDPEPAPNRETRRALARALRKGKRR